jgi:nitrate reductase / nitrite oxidoreductase, alpha subunit
MGGVSLSFYDWYCDLPPASPETWGEQTDVARVGRLVQRQAAGGDGLEPEHDPHAGLPLRAEARHNGTKMWVFSPDFSQVAKYADEWVAINAGQDGAWWMAVNHVLLKEFHHERQTPYFLDYAKQVHRRAVSWSSSTARGDGYRSRASCCAPTASSYRDEENGEWKFLMWDEKPTNAQDADGQRRASAGARSKASGT